MHGGVGTDEILFPTSRWSCRIVPIQRLSIVRALVAEKLAEGVAPRAAGNQNVPEIVSNLVTEMTQQGAVRLLLQGALLLAMNVIRLGNVDGDQSVVVAGEHPFRIAVARILEELEREP